jgi:hypothetical protein
MATQFALLIALAIAQAAQPPPPTGARTPRPAAGAMAEGGSVGPAGAGPSSNVRVAVLPIEPLVMVPGTATNCIVDARFPRDGTTAHSMFVSFTACGAADLAEAAISRDGDAIVVTQPYCVDAARTDAPPPRRVRVPLGRLPAGQYTIQFVPRDTCRPGLTSASAIGAVTVTAHANEPLVCEKPGAAPKHEYGPPPRGPRPLRPVSVARIAADSTCAVIEEDLAARTHAPATPERMTELALSACDDGRQPWLVRVPGTRDGRTPGAVMDDEGFLYIDLPLDGGMGAEAGQSLLSACTPLDVRGVRVWDGAAIARVEQQRAAGETERRAWARNWLAAVLAITIAFAAGFAWYVRTAPPAPSDGPPARIGWSGGIAAVSWVFTAISLYWALRMFGPTYSGSHGSLQGWAALFGTASAIVQTVLAALATTVAIVARRADLARFLAWCIVLPTALAWIPLYLFLFAVLSFATE